MTALPGGMNDAGKFLLWLRNTGQTAWQMLPIHETSLEINSKTKHVPSPYKGYGVGIDPSLTPINWKKRRPTKIELQNFRSKNQAWLPDYALFIALRNYFGSDQWPTWPLDIRQRQAQA